MPRGLADAAGLQRRRHALKSLADLRTIGNQAQRLSTRREHPMLANRFAILIFATLLLAAAPVVASAEPRDPGQYFFDQTFGDFSEELQNARDQGKHGLLLMFEMDECPFCHRMKTTVLNQPAVQDYFKAHFLIFPVDVEGDIEVTDFEGNATAQKDLALKQFRVRATPVFAFFDLDGNLVARYTGATRDSDEFMLLGQYVVEGAYKDTTFTKYKHAHQQKSAASSSSADLQASGAGAD
jgi:thioredoxin-related protein